MLQCHNSAARPTRSNKAVVPVFGFCEASDDIYKETMPFFEKRYILSENIKYFKLGTPVLNEVACSGRLLAGK